MNNNNFSLALAQDLIDSGRQFPVNFDDAWQWLGYSRKERAFTKLKKHFEEGLDFCTNYCKTSQGGRPSVSVYIAIDCFKSLGMMAGTEQGKLVRKYFLECEKKWELTKQHFPEVAQDVEMIKLVDILPR
jgi:anti-repressor protein